MKKIVLTFGLISGGILCVLMALSLVFSKQIGFDHSMYLGYTIMVLSFLLVFFGIRSYRDNVGGGQITFGRGIAVGLLITLITCVCYVVMWEIMYFKFMPHFMDDYGAHIVAKMQAAGASAAAIQAQVAQMAELTRKYQNPLFNSAMTFMEPFPVGLLVTLISAAVLRKKHPGQMALQP